MTDSIRKIHMGTDGKIVTYNPETHFVNENGFVVPIPREPQPEVIKRPVGRPKGSTRPKTLNSKNPAAVLAALGFDPLLQQVKQYDELTDMIATERAKPKVNGVLVASLIATRQKISNELSRYGYARVSETTEVNHKGAMPTMTIVTTPKGWKPGDPTPGVSNSEDPHGLEGGLPSEDLEEDPEAYPDYTDVGEQRIARVARQDEEADFQRE